MGLAHRQGFLSPAVVFSAGNVVRARLKLIDDAADTGSFSDAAGPLAHALLTTQSENGVSGQWSGRP
jgi:hypothetical protein